MLGDKYRIQISVPGKGLSDTAFVNNVLEWSFEKEDGQIYYRKKIASPLVFRDDIDLNKTDFTDLYKLERSRASRCDKIDVIIFKKCFGGAETQYWNGYLSLIDGKWNKSTCEVEIIPRPQDQYTCLYENWEKDINILNIPIIDKYDARSTIGVIEYSPVCERTTFTQKGDSAYIGNSSCLGGTDNTVPAGWTLVYWQIDIGVRVRTIWAREVFIGDQPGPDWIPDSGRWVRGVEIVENLNAFIDEPGKYSKTWKIVQYTLTNGMKLSQVLPEMIKTLQTCQYTLVSNFFGIAPDGTAPTNRAYSNAFDHVRNILIYEKQDVRRAKDKDQSSSFLEVSIKRMFENLKALFGVEFLIEDDTNKIRLEHISYFQDRRMLDLTQERFLDDIDGKWKYSYVKESLPIREEFKFMEPTTALFDGLPIEYGETCSNDDKKSNEIIFTADYVVTAVDDVVENPDKYSENGMLFVEVNPTGSIVAGLVKGNRVLRNGNLSWTSLQDFYHRWNRPQEYGTMNGQNTRFETFKRTRKQEPIQLQLCCSDFEQFNPLDLVRTQLGWGEILSARYSDPSEQLTLELLHD